MIDYDQQVLESVGVRRMRLLKAVLFNGERTRRKYEDGVKLIVISAVLATLACAGCVGYSFIIDLFSQHEEQQPNIQFVMGGAV